MHQAQAECFAKFSVPESHTLSQFKQFLLFYAKEYSTMSACFIKFRMSDGASKFRLSQENSLLFEQIKRLQSKIIK